MIIFSKFGQYDRRSFIEECLEKYLETVKLTKLAGEAKEIKNSNDKPYFKDYPDIRFSISHSGDLVVLAMSDKEVGIDIEKIKDRPYEQVAARTFSEGERREVTDLKSFLAVWTKKEAYLKFTSEGLGGMQAADISKTINYNGDQLEFTTLDIFDGFVGAVVAVEQPIIYVDLN